MGLGLDLANFKVPYGGWKTTFLKKDVILGIFFSSGDGIHAATVNQCKSNEIPTILNPLQILFPRKISAFALIESH